MAGISGMDCSRKNFFTLNRRLLEHPLWRTEKFTRGQAWVDMVGLANYKPGYIRVNGCRIELTRGDLAWSKTQLSERWRWSRNKVIRFFEELETDGSISVVMKHPTSVVNITNYGRYQLHSMDSGAMDGAMDEAVDEAVNRATDESRSIREIRNNNKNTPIVPKGDGVDLIESEFSRWWDIYPSGKRKVNKKGCLRKWRALVKAGELPAVGVMLSALESQRGSKDWVKDGGEFVPMPLTYLNQGRWDAVASGSNGHGGDLEDYSLEAEAKRKGLVVLE